jgi:ribulose-phosphate 3-epimerase
MSYIPIVPAVIPKSREEVLSFAEKLCFSREFHLDLVDGKFVTAVSWPYDPTGAALSVKPQLDKYTLEVDLMVENPLTAAAEWVVAGADMLVFHVETLSLDEFRSFADKTVLSVGISAHGDTSLETLISYAEYADYIQLMGIYKIGAQGLPFDETVLDKLVALKNRFPNLPITVDGSVNADTIVRLKKAGADRFICGSAIVKQDNPEAAHAVLSALIND